jgi:hypothetical protein
MSVQTVRRGWQTDYVKRPSRLPLYIGLPLVVAGWAALFVGWYQAGRQDLQTGQIPYVLSGGFGGWALLAMGSLAIFIDVVRQIEWRAHVHLHDVQITLERLGEALRQSTVRAPSPTSSEPSADGARPPRKRSRRRRGGGRNKPAPTEGSS